MFLCGSGSGSGSFSHEDKDDKDQLPLNPCSTPKRTKRCHSFGSNKNPYADRGLDKFYALLAEHDDKKQRILKQRGSEDISLVRFVYPNESDKAKPIVVKAKEKKSETKKKATDLMEKRGEKGSGSADSPAIAGEKKQGKKKMENCLSFGAEVLKEPCYYLPVMGVLILVLLAIFGRSFAVLCLSIGWYLVPSLQESVSLSPERKHKRKKEHVMKQSEGPSSPRSVLNGPQQNQPKGHKHMRSW